MRKRHVMLNVVLLPARVRVYGRGNVSSMAHAEYRYRLHVLHRQTKLGAMEGTPEPREIPWVCCLHGDPVQVRYTVLLRSVQCPGGTFPQRSQGKRAVLRIRHRLQTLV